ncbi:hypothetical protein PAPYR_12685 [Paratrimastix pyriformis]|uniref:Uncharacterized protein n=1 Tax=Paratrimastix pyriformis TaxID=342808 RepID=A0ABQ8U1G7_9EUKA|nr:hypothetical protein PAPYR_12685 [Paratrimastix pyriformis]
MKRINGEALRASAKLSASIRREGGHMNGFGASRYPDMGGDFYDRQRVEAPSEEEQARIRAVQQHVAEQMWPVLKEFLGGEKNISPSKCKNSHSFNVSSEHSALMHFEASFSI